jgi:hypothetical protein
MKMRFSRTCEFCLRDCSTAIRCDVGTWAKQQAKETWWGCPHMLKGVSHKRLKNAFILYYIPYLQILFHCEVRVVNAVPFTVFLAWKVEFVISSHVCKMKPAFLVQQVKSMLQIKSFESKTFNVMVQTETLVVQAKILARIPLSASN